MCREVSINNSITKNYDTGLPTRPRDQEKGNATGYRNLTNGLRANSAAPSPAMAHCPVSTDLEFRRHMTFTLRPPEIMIVAQLGQARPAFWHSAGQQ